MFGQTSKWASFPFAKEPSLKRALNPFSFQAECLMQHAHNYESLFSAWNYKNYFEDNTKLHLQLSFINVIWLSPIFRSQRAIILD